jgi:hypothetical protein
MFAVSKGGVLFESVSESGVAYASTLVCFGGRSEKGVGDVGVDGELESRGRRYSDCGYE